MAGTYLLPVPVGHRERESGLEPSKRHLFPRNSTHTGHGLGVPHRSMTPGRHHASPQHGSAHLL